MRVIQNDVLRQAIRPIDERGVEPEYAGIRFIARQLIGLRFAQRNESRGPPRGNFARVDLMQEVAIDNPFGPRRGSGRAIFGIDAGNACDDPIGFAQIETRIETERHDGRCGARRADTRGDREHAVLVEPQVTSALRKREHGKQVLTLDPVLQLARPIAEVRAGLEHGYNYDLDLDGLLRVSRDRQGKRECEEADGDSHGASG